MSSAITESTVRRNITPTATPFRKSQRDKPAERRLVGGENEIRPQNHRGHHQGDARFAHQVFRDVQERQRERRHQAAQTETAAAKAL
jgi:hypothetical protein